MQNRATFRKAKIILVLAALVPAAALSAYLLIYHEPPLTVGPRTVVSASVIAGINETISFGFSLKNKGIAPLVIEEVKTSLSDEQFEIVEIVFVKSVRGQVMGVINGTSEDNGFDAFPVEGYTIAPRENAELAVAIKAVAAGDHAVKGLLFKYTYLGWNYEFAYDEHFLGFTISVRDSP